MLTQFISATILINNNNLKYINNLFSHYRDVADSINKISIILSLRNAWLLNMRNKAEGDLWIITLFILIKYDIVCVREFNNSIHFKLLLVISPIHASVGYFCLHLKANYFSIYLRSFL